MRTRSNWIWCWMIGAVLASGAGAQQYTTIIDNLPTCTGNRNGRVISVSDAVSDADCTEGGATGEDRFVHQCICDTLNALGPYWKAVGGGGGSSGPATALESPVVIEGTADAFEGNFTFADPTADWTWAWGADGTLTGATQLNLENLRLDGNTLSTTNTNGNLVLAPNGTGSVLVPAGAAMSTPGILFDNNEAIWARGGGYLAIGSNTTQYVELSAFGVQALEGGSISWFPSGGPSTTNTAMKRAANGIVAFSDGSTGGGAIHLNPFASPPRTCDATAEGDIYSDTSHALCWCDATTWQKLSGAGTCA